MDPSELIKWFSTILPFLKPLYEKLKKKPKSVILPQDQQTIQKLFKRLEELNKLFGDMSVSQFEEIKQQIPEVEEVKDLARKLQTDYIPVWVDERFGIVPKETAIGDVLEKFESGIDESEPKLDLIPLSQAEDFISFREIPKPIPEQLLGIVDKLSSEFKSLLYISAHVEKLYEMRLVDEAEEIKKRIRSRYDEFGIKFCNLYLRGYLKTLLLSLADKPENVSNAKIRQFILRDTRDVFFIHKRMGMRETQDVAEQLQRALESQEEYIAIHSLGGAKIIAKLIVGEAEGKAGLEGFETVIVDTQNEFSKMWYRNRGKETLNYILIPLV